MSKISEWFKISKKHVSLDWLKNGGKENGTLHYGPVNIVVERSEKRNNDKRHKKDLDNFVTKLVFWGND